MMRMGVPVATPVTAEEIGAAVRGLFYPAEYRCQFASSLQAFLGTNSVHLTSSGRAALFLCLRAMRQLRNRDEVVVPAFVCPSVARAAKKAGLTVKVCDVGSTGCGLDDTHLASLLTSKTLAVIYADLFGYPAGCDRTIAAARSCGAFAIEDAAQAFGAKRNECPAGTRGDAGVFSFGLSKVLWGIAGGAIVTDSAELAGQLDMFCGAVPPPSVPYAIAGIIRFAVLGYLVKSHNLGALAAIWAAFLRGSDDALDFQVAQMPGPNAAAALSLVRRLPEIMATRQRHARQLSQELSGFTGIDLPDAATCDSACLRFPVIVHEVADKRMILRILRQRGINASEMYTPANLEAVRTIADSSSPCPRAEYLAYRILNLPTHAYVTNADLAHAVDAFASILPRKSTTTARQRAVACAR